MEKIVLVTGGSRGIGAATALLAARHGYAIGVNYVNNETAARRVVEQIESAGGRAAALQADISTESGVVHLFRELDLRLGTLTALVNNAGILDTQTTLEHMTEERLNRVFTTNITGSFLCAREAVRRMSTSNSGAGGAIVNVSSGAARAGSPNEYIDYAASKGAIDTLTIGLAREVAGQGIRVNAVRPGFIYTDIHILGGEPGRVGRVREFVPLKRGGTAEEVAEAIYWLLSEKSSYTTGAFIDVTGGR